MIIIFLLLATLGAFLGLIIAFVTLFLVIGFINAVIAAQLWFPMKWGFWKFTEHSIILFVLLSILNFIIVYLPYQAFPAAETRAATFIVAMFVKGYICKAVTSFFKRVFPLDVSEVVEAEWADRDL